MDCLINLKRKGKIRAIGVSNMLLQQLKSHRRLRALILTNLLQHAL